jgi:ribosomal protein S18 acetylase RimI-like enzyme
MAPQQWFCTQETGTLEQAHGSRLPMDAVPTPEPARTSEWAHALRLIFHHLPLAERRAREATGLEMLQRGEMDPQGLLVLRGPEGLDGALVCLSVPGASALIWPPGVGVHPLQRVREDALVRHALDWLRGRGVKLVQALLAPEEEYLGAPLLRNGFNYITELWYMQHERGTPLGLLDTPARLEFRPFDESDPLPFQQTLLRTYEGTLDCPELGGVRSGEEVLAGHRAQGTYDPDRWWLALDAGRPAGVLILTELPETGEWDVAYMGVVPEARRRGFGREILLKALAEARAADVQRVVLSVDVRNRPAWELYRGIGFEPYDRRSVYLSIWR